MARLGAVIVCMILAISLVATPIMGATYIVGDSDGWNLGVDYTSWASTKTFKVGDSLVFNYGSSHSVLEVSSGEYISCTLNNALSADRSGATTITLKTPRSHYFVCGVPGHCDDGQKLAVTVSANDTAAADAPPPVATSQTPAITANAPTSTENNYVTHSSFVTNLSPTIAATIFFMALVALWCLN